MRQPPNGENKLMTANVSWGTPSMDMFLRFYGRYLSATPSTGKFPYPVRRGSRITPTTSLIICRLTFDREQFNERQNND